MGLKDKMNKYLQDSYMEKYGDRVASASGTVVSIKFTEKGFIKIILGKENDKASIIIEDSGIGIKEDKIAYLFNKFYTANNYGDATNGAGLGLNIVKNIIDLHGGKINIESSIGKGTTVKILI